MQGLNFLVSNQLDLAIDEIGQAAKIDPDALEIHMILGNLYREKGQVSRAVQIHQHLLQRPRLRASNTPTSSSVSASTIAAAASSIARSRRSTRCCGSIRPTSTRWSSSKGSTRISITGSRRDDSRAADQDRAPGRQARHRTIRAFLENQIGMQALGLGDPAAATRHFKPAIDLDPACAGVPQPWRRDAAKGDHRRCGDLGEADGGLARAGLSGVRSAHRLPATPRAPERFDGSAAADRRKPQDWRARLALAVICVPRASPPRRSC